MELVKLTTIKHKGVLKGALTGNWNQCNGVSRLPHHDMSGKKLTQLRELSSNPDACSVASQT